MVGQPFLTTKLANHLVAVEVAWGADLTDLDGSGWSWMDITTSVVFDGDGDEGSAVRIQIGRPDESQETQACEMTCRLDNRSGAYSTDGMSTNWPNVRRGTPVRVRVSTNGGSSWSLRFQGSAVGFSPEWDEETGRWATVVLTASGPLRRLNQGTLAARSAMYMGTMADPSVLHYWPCEDEYGSTFVAPAIGEGNGTFQIYDLNTGGQIPGRAGEFAGNSTIPSSAPLVVLADGGDLTLDIPGNITASAVTVSAFYSGIMQITPWDGTTQNPIRGQDQVGALCSIYTAGAAAGKVWDVYYSGGTNLRLSVYPATLHTYGVNTIINRNLNFHLVHEVDYEVALRLSQSGTTTNYELWVRPLDNIVGWAATGTLANNSNGCDVSGIQLGAFSDTPGLAVGHCVVRNTSVADDYDFAWSSAHAGEATLDRFERLCLENGIHSVVLDSSFTVNSSITDTMGPQYYDTLTALLREIESTGQGLLYDGLGPGLTYVTKEYREAAAAASAALTLDAASGHLMEPFAPVDDDQKTINHATVNRHNGTTRHYADRSGSLGADKIGEFATSITPNPISDDNLIRYAEWLVSAGTYEGYRYPSVSFALETNNSLIPSWLACTPQSRIDVTNAAAVRRGHSNNTVRLLLEGWQETISAFTWRVTANTSPAEPWNVVRLASPTGSTGDDICHMDTDSSQLNTSVALGATSISVRTNSGPLWVTSAADADSFPFDISLGGARVTVTAISGASSPQTFTVSALPRAFTGSTTPGAGAPIKVWNPPVLGL